VLVVGAGAVGLGMASALLRSGSLPAGGLTLLGRPATVHALRQQGLRQSGIFGEVWHRPDSFHATDDLSMAQGPFGCVLVCVKAWQSPPTARQLAEAPGGLMKQGAALVLCQNGWGNHTTFAEYHDPSRIACARVITGFRRPALHHVEVTVHAAPVAMGNPFGHEMAGLHALAKALSAGSLPTHATPNIVADLWAKLLYNAALNPLGALFRVPYGELAARPPGRRLMEAVVREGFAVMNAGGYSTHWATPEAFLAAFYGQQVPTTAAHRSSMLQDIEAGRPTEIDAINGAIVALGQAHGVATPVNASLVELIHFAQGDAR
jgi:2-dehydropantoate 2-reductase